MFSPTCLLSFQEKPRSHRNHDQSQDDPGSGAFFLLLGGAAGDVKTHILFPGVDLLLSFGLLLFFQVLNQAQVRVQRGAALYAEGAGILIGVAAFGTAF